MTDNGTSRMRQSATAERHWFVARRLLVARTLQRVTSTSPDVTPGGRAPRPYELTHVDESGAARMVDVSTKEVTVRRAVAAGRVQTTAQVVALLSRDALPKGDALGVARIAGIMGAKRTPDLIPLCHPIALHGVDLALRLDESSVDITATVRTADRTGVEMEALTAVATAGLALIDMIKAVDPAAVLDGVRVLRKEGGKTGLWVRADTADGAADDESPAGAP